MVKVIANGSNCSACSMNNGECANYRQQMAFQMKRTISADLGDGIKPVFLKGSTLQGWGVIKDQTLFCVGAESPLVKGYSDMLALNALNVVSG